VGVCWCLTADDRSNDGGKRNYLTDPARWRYYDPELFDLLQRLNRPDVSLSVALAADWKLVPGAVYFDALLPDERNTRAAYIVQAVRMLRNVDIVFVDPDNGIEVPSTKVGSVGSSKYVCWHELRDFYAAGKSLLVYQHYPRVARQRFIPFVADHIRAELGAETVTAFSTAHAAFFLVTQASHERALSELPRDLERRWAGQIKPLSPTSLVERATTAEVDRFVGIDELNFDLRALIEASIEAGFGTSIPEGIADFIVAEMEASGLRSLGDHAARFDAGRTRSHYHAAVIAAILRWRREVSRQPTPDQREAYRRPLGE
jgi:hypothetical protein